MKSRALLRIGICVAVLLVPMQLHAVVGPQGVSDTAHNMGYLATNPRAWSSANPAGGYGTTEVCVFCHTPHNSSGDLPLWNRYSSSGSRVYLMYTSSAT